MHSIKQETWGRRWKMHGGEKLNQCNRCDYVYSDPSTLRAHLKWHSGEKSNKCNQCDFASSYVGDLRRHLTIHSGEKSNKCNQCDYASFGASDLKRHLIIHSGENQWVTEGLRSKKCSKHDSTVENSCKVPGCDFLSQNFHHDEDKAHFNLLHRTQNFTEYSTRCYKYRFTMHYAAIHLYK